jgi:hypothetical protein
MKPPILAAIAIAEQHGIPPDRCEILQDAHTIVVRLTDSLVARIVTDTDGPRQGTAWFTRETAIAAHLSQCRAPVIPLHPAIPPLAHTHDGYTMNFWQFVTASDAAPAPRDMAITLHHCHAALRSFDPPLPPLAILHESLALLDEKIVRSAFRGSDIRLLRHHLETSLSHIALLPQQPLHGDAHTGNFLMTTRGLLLTDWEDAFAGPIEWDIASLIWNAKLLDHDAATTGEILATYQSCGTPVNMDALDQCLIARAAVMSAWYPLLYPDPSPDRVRKLNHRMDWLRAME